MKQSDSSEQNTERINSWRHANREHIDAELSRLRLTLHRRILWLRQLWKRDPLQGFREWVISDADADRLLAEAQPNDAEAFYARDTAAAEWSRGIAAQRENAQSAALRADAAGSPPALEILARLFHLDDFDRDVLVLCLAPELDPSFERLYAYVQDDATRKFPTAHLALDLFGRDYFARDRDAWSEAWKYFVPEAPLARSRLIRWESAGDGTRCGEALRL